MRHGLERSLFVEPPSYITPEALMNVYINCLWRDGMWYTGTVRSKRSDRETFIIDWDRCRGSLSTSDERLLPLGHENSVTFLVSRESLRKIMGVLEADLAPDPNVIRGTVCSILHPILNISTFDRLTESP